MLRFGPFELHREQRRLYRDAKLIPLGSRAFDILTILASRAGEVVGHDELIAAVWPNVFVAENNLRVNMTALRKALGPEGSATDGYIANVPGRGYSFVAAVTQSGAEPKKVQTVGGDGALRRLPRPLGTVFGREAALAALAANLAERRLITIAGSGGIGKTTLVLAAADLLSAAYPDGVALVDLAPIGDPGLVATAVASSLGYAFRNDNLVSELSAAIGDRRILVVLDSCEHVVEAAALLAEQLLRGTSRLGVLATSRELLRAEGEWVLALPPLEAPDRGADGSAQAAKASPAVQLFIDRASASGGGFVFDDGSAPFVADICRQLDGIALAIELAASRVETLGVKALAASLGDRFQVLNRGRRTALPRHQTLRATLDWSYNLLTALEQRVLYRLSTLVGRFPSRAALAIAADAAASDFSVEEALANLVAKSLVWVDGNFDPTALRLADTTRAYGFEKLRDAGELDKAKRAHAKFFLEAFEAAEKDFEDLSAIDWLELYGWQIDDLRAALDWSFGPAGDSDLGVALTALAIPLWHQLSLVDECLKRAAHALSLVPASRRDKRRTQLQSALGWPQMQAVSGLPSGAEAWRETLSLAESIGNFDYQLRSLWALWVDRTNSGEPAEAMGLADRFRALSRRSRERSDEAVADRMRGATLHLFGRQREARESLETMLSRYEEQWQRRHIVRFQYDQRLLAEVALARVLWLQGEAVGSLTLVEELIEHARRLDHSLTYAGALAEAACPIALMAEDFERAERYIALLRKETRAPSMDVWRTYADAFEGELAIRSGKPEFGLGKMKPALAVLRANGFVLYDMAFRAVAATGLRDIGARCEAVAEVDLALAQCQRTGEGYCLPELQRLRGLLWSDEGNSSKARDLLGSALEQARQQGAVFWQAGIERSIASWDLELSLQSGALSIAP